MTDDKKEGFQPKTQSYIKTPFVGKSSNRVVDNNSNELDDELEKVAYQIEREMLNDEIDEITAKKLTKMMIDEIRSKVLKDKEVNDSIEIPEDFESINIELLTSLVEENNIKKFDDGSIVITIPKEKTKGNYKDEIYYSVEKFLQERLGLSGKYCSIKELKVIIHPDKRDKFLVQHQRLKSLSIRRRKWSSIQEKYIKACSFFEDESLLIHRVFHPAGSGIEKQKSYLGDGYYFFSKINEEREHHVLICDILVGKVFPKAYVSFTKVSSEFDSILSFVRKKVPSQRFCVDNKDFKTLVCRFPGENYYPVIDKNEEVENEYLVLRKERMILPRFSVTFDVVENVPSNNNGMRVSGMQIGSRVLNNEILEDKDLNGVIENKEDIVLRIQNNLSSLNTKLRNLTIRRYDYDDLQDNNNNNNTEVGRNSRRATRQRRCSLSDDNTVYLKGRQCILKNCVVEGLHVEICENSIAYITDCEVKGNVKITVNDGSILRVVSSTISCDGGIVSLGSAKVMIHTSKITSMIGLTVKGSSLLTLENNKFRGCIHAIRCFDNAKVNSLSDEFMGCKSSVLIVAGEGEARMKNCSFGRTVSRPSLHVQGLGKCEFEKCLFKSNVSVYLDDVMWREDQNVYNDSLSSTSSSTGLSSQRLKKSRTFLKHEFQGCTFESFSVISCGSGQSLYPQFKKCHFEKASLKMNSTRSKFQGNVFKEECRIEFGEGCNYGILEENEFWGKCIVLCETNSITTIKRNKFQSSLVRIREGCRSSLIGNIFSGGPVVPVEALLGKRNRHSHEDDEENSQKMRRGDFSPKMILRSADFTKKGSKSSKKCRVAEEEEGEENFVKLFLVVRQNEFRDCKEGISIKSSIVLCVKFVEVECFSEFSSRSTSFEEEDFDLNHQKDNNNTLDVCHDEFEDTDRLAKSNPTLSKNKMIICRPSSLSRLNSSMTPPDKKRRACSTRQMRKIRCPSKRLSSSFEVGKKKIGANRVLPSVHRVSTTSKRRRRSGGSKSRVSDIRRKFHSSKSLSSPSLTLPNDINDRKKRGMKMKMLMKNKKKENDEKEEEEKLEVLKIERKKFMRSMEIVRRTPRKRVFKMSHTTGNIVSTNKPKNNNNNRRKRRRRNVVVSVEEEEEVELEDDDHEEDYFQKRPPDENGDEFQVEDETDDYYDEQEELLKPKRTYFTLHMDNNTFSNVDVGITLENLPDVRLKHNKFEGCRIGLCSRGSHLISHSSTFSSNCTGCVLTKKSKVFLNAAKFKSNERDADIRDCHLRIDDSEFLGAEEYSLFINSGKESTNVNVITRSSFLKLSKRGVIIRGQSVVQVDHCIFNLFSRSSPFSTFREADYDSISCVLKDEGGTESPNIRVAEEDDERRLSMLNQRKRIFAIEIGDSSYVKISKNHLYSSTEEAENRAKEEEEEDISYNQQNMVDLKPMKQMFGFVGEGKSRITFEKNRVTGLSYGMSIHGSCSGLIQRNEFESCKIGLFCSGDELVFHVLGNEFQNCQNGMLVLNHSNKMIIIEKQNQFEKNRNGLMLVRSECIIRENEFMNNEVALVVKTKSCPLVNYNIFSRNRVGVLIKEKSNPKLSENVFEMGWCHDIVISSRSLPIIKGNYFHLSPYTNSVLIKDYSFPSIVRNDFIGNRNDGSNDFVYSYLPSPFSSTKSSSSSSSSRKYKRSEIIRSRMRSLKKREVFTIVIEGMSNCVFSENKLKNIFSNDHESGGILVNNSSGDKSIQIHANSFIGSNPSSIVVRGRSLVNIEKNKFFRSSTTIIDQFTETKTRTTNQKEEEEGEEDSDEDRRRNRKNQSQQQQQEEVIILVEDENQAKKKNKIQEQFDFRSFLMCNSSTSTHEQIEVMSHIPIFNINIDHENNNNNNNRSSVIVVSGESQGNITQNLFSDHNVAISCLENTQFLIKKNVFRRVDVCVFFNLSFSDVTPASKDMNLSPKKEEEIRKVVLVPQEQASISSFFQETPTPPPTTETRTIPSISPATTLINNSELEEEEMNFQGRRVRSNCAVDSNSFKEAKIAIFCTSYELSSGMNYSDYNDRVHQKIENNEFSGISFSCFVGCGMNKTIFSDNLIKEANHAILCLQNSFSMIRDNHIQTLENSIVTKGSSKGSILSNHFHEGNMLIYADEMSHFQVYKNHFLVSKMAVLWCKGVNSRCVLGENHFGEGHDEYGVVVEDAASVVLENMNIRAKTCGVKVVSRARAVLHKISIREARLGMDLEGQGVEAKVVDCVFVENDIGVKMNSVRNDYVVFEQCSLLRNHTGLLLEEIIPGQKKSILDIHGVSKEEKGGMMTAINSSITFIRNQTMSKKRKKKKTGGGNYHHENGKSKNNQFYGNKTDIFCEKFKLDDSMSSLNNNNNNNKLSQQRSRRNRRRKSGQGSCEEKIAEELEQEYHLNQKLFLESLFPKHDPDSVVYSFRNQKKRKKRVSLNYLLKLGSSENFGRIRISEKKKKKVESNQQEKDEEEKEVKQEQEEEEEIEIILNERTSRSPNKKKKKKEKSGQLYQLPLCKPCMTSCCCDHVFPKRVLLFLVPLVVNVCLLIWITSLLLFYSFGVVQGMVIPRRREGKMKYNYVVVDGLVFSSLVFVFCFILAWSCCLVVSNCCCCFLSPRPCELCYSLRRSRRRKKKKKKKKKQFLIHRVLDLVRCCEIGRKCWIVGCTECSLLLISLLLLSLITFVIPVLSSSWIMIITICVLDACLVFPLLVCVFIHCCCCLLCCSGRSCVNRSFVNYCV